MTKYVLYGLVGLLFLGLQACQRTAETDGKVGFSIGYNADTTVITVVSPWNKGEVMAQYRLTASYQRIACTSATHIGFLRELGLLNRVVGVCRPDRIYNLTDEQRAAIVDFGDDMKPNLEAILLAQPDAIMVSTYAEGDAVIAQIAALGIPVLYCNEWTESTPLARAEWIRFFGACFGCLDLADSVYHSVKDAYTKEVVTTTEDSPWIMSGQSFRGTWYVPTGNTYMGNLFRDAGANYVYMDNMGTASLPLTMEQALQDFSGADVWVGCSARSLEELAVIDKTHTWFHAYQEGLVYNFYHRTLPSGANDFWETGVVHPELILHDLRMILHSAANKDTTISSVGSVVTFTSDTLFFSEKLQ